MAQIRGLPVPAKEAGSLLTQHYHTAQRAIAQRGSRAIHSLWHEHVDPAHFSRSWYNLGPVVNGIVSTHNGMSAAQAAQYYANSRVVAGHPFFHVPGKPVDDAYIDTVMGAMGPGAFYHYLGEDYTDDEAADMAIDGLVGAAERMILMGGRDTVTDASVQDPQAEGWERVVEAGACDFCAMLAGRGAVYSESTVDFQAHDHCACVAAPVFAEASNE